MRMILQLLLPMREAVMLSVEDQKNESNIQLFLLMELFL